MTRTAKTFERGEVVVVRTTPDSTVWREAKYLGEYTIHYGQRSWHQVQFNADKIHVPIGRIRKRSVTK